MLYIIYGLTNIVANTTRAYFRDRGIRVIEKLTYETANTRIQPSTGTLTRADSLEQVNRCDYVYENHGRIVGFTVEQIESAVHGRDDALLTFSSEDLTFLRELKTAYGDHVAILYAFLEDKCLTALTNGLSAPEDQKRERLAMGRSIKERFLTERDLFDEVVLYTGEGTHFDLEHLVSQYDHIIKKYNERERELVPLPYTGSKPYIFVSYARIDTDKVLPWLRLLQRNGCRIWFDRGIRGGDNWLTTLALKIRHCTQYLLFSSEASVSSNWTKKEILQALDIPAIRTLTIRMDGARFDAGIEMGLKGEHHLFMEQENFEQALLDAILPEVTERIGS